MSNPKWTPEQQQAIDARNCDVLVSAAAGSGKTAVLVERIIKRITGAERVDVDKLLVVTFTKAAAAEMRERIGSAILRKINEHPASGHLSRQLILLNKAAITTLHSFCLDVLRKYFYRINLDPAFRVAEDTEAALLRQEALDDLFEECYTVGQSGFVTLVDAYGGDKDDSYLQETVLRLYDFASSHPWPDNWLMSLGKGYACQEGLPLDRLDWGRELLQWISLALEGCRKKILKSVKLAVSPKGPLVYRDNLNDDIGLIDDLITAANISWQQLYEEINRVEFSKLKSCRDKNVDEILKKRVSSARDAVKKTVRSIREELFSRPQEDLIADLQLAAPMADYLAKLVIDFGERYKMVKTEKSLVDFSDLEHYCLKILMDEASSPERVIPSKIAREFKAYFAEIYVDEYQDINEVQETILHLISREEHNKPNRFMVGDVKQSIYGFRLADPRLFMQKYQTYPRLPGEVRLGIDLKQNFRSRSGILDAVNFIFRQIMTIRTGQIEYDDKAELVCGADYPPETGGVITAAGSVELHLLEKKANELETTEKNQVSNEVEFDVEAEFEAGTDTPGFQVEMDELDAVQREACLVGKRIQQIIHGTGEIPGPEFHIYDKKTGGYRLVQYRDIVILLRTTKNVVNSFMEELRKIGIPAYAELGTGYFEATEIETMMALLKIIDNPRQDIPLAALLRSPIVGLNAGEMAEVKLRYPNGDYYDAVRRSAELGETGVDLKLRKLLEDIEAWRTMARQGPLSELIWHLYNVTGYYSYVGGMPGGAQRQSNLRALQDRARQYEATSFRGLFRFLRFIEKFQESGNDLGTARALGENENVVRLISIHKSKGLEFPVVIVAGLGKQFNLNDLKQKVLLHKQLGIGLPVVDVDNYLMYQTVAQHAIKKRLLLELLAEEMRVLYVALTRAKEKLILVGSVRDVAKAVNRWCDNISVAEWQLPDTTLTEAGSFLDWICPAVARHPDGLILREMSLCEEPMGVTVEDSSRWRVYTYKPCDILSAVKETIDEQTEMIELVRQFKPVQTTGAYAQIIDNRLSWKYPQAEMVGKPVKVSVTEIKRRFAEEVDNEEIVNLDQAFSFPKPVFLAQTTELSAAERGSAMHLVMQHLRLNGDLTESGIKEQLESMINSELLNSEQAKAVDVRVISKLFDLPLGQKIKSAERVKREVPFIMAIPAYKIYPELDKQSGESVLVQGIIDCLLEDDDGYLIIDYKTDAAHGDTNQIKNRYQGQMNLYAEAVEKILLKPVKGKYLYLFSVGLDIKCD